MLRLSSTEAKLARWQVTSTAFLGLFALLIPATSPAYVPPGGLPWTAILIRNASRTTSSASRESEEARPRPRWRTKDRDNMALSEETHYLRAWKLFPNPSPSRDVTTPPEYAPTELDALVDNLGDQIVRIYVPKDKSQFQSFDLHQHYPEAKQSTAYALTSVETEEATATTLQLRTSNSVRIWLNGNLVLTQSAPRFGRAATSSADITLDAGENVLLVECMQGERNWGFSLGMHNSERVASKEQKRTAANSAQPK